MTNADRIRSMTDDELYEFLSMWEIGDIDYSVTFCDLCKKDGNTLNLDCDGCRKHWIKSSADAYNGINSFPDFKAGQKPERKKGQWIEGKTLEKCSICGKKGFPDWRYCPNCGADMRGKEE